MFRHCRHLQGAYAKISLKRVTINTNHIIITNKQYTAIDILLNGIQFGSRIGICVMQ